MNDHFTCTDCGAACRLSVLHDCPRSLRARLDAMESRCDKLEAIVERLAVNTGTTVDEILQRVAEDVP
jgi:hypothetical protein